MSWVALLLIHGLGFPSCSLIGWVSRLVLSWRLVASYGTSSPMDALLDLRCGGKPCLAIDVCGCHSELTLRGRTPPGLQCLGISH